MKSSTTTQRRVGDLDYLRNFVKKCYLCSLNISSKENKEFSTVSLAIQIHV